MMPGAAVVWAWLSLRKANHVHVNADERYRTTAPSNTSQAFNFVPFSYGSGRCHRHARGSSAAHDQDHPIQGRLCGAAGEHSFLRSPAIAAMMAWLCGTVCTLILLASSAFCLHPPDVSRRMQSGTVLHIRCHLLYAAAYPLCMAPSFTESPACLLDAGAEAPQGSAGHTAPV